MTTVALVQCYGLMQPPNAEPLSIATLAGAVQEHFGGRVSVELLILDERNDPTGAHLASLIASRVDILGISAPQSTYALVCSFLEQVLLLNNRALVTLGHALPTYTPEAFLARFPTALIVRGWGEESICQIIEQHLTGQPDWSGIPNLVFREGGRTVHSAIEWPKTLPRPARLRAHDFFVRVEASRGCFYDACTFCTRPLRAKESQSWVAFPVDHVISEVRKLTDQGVRTFTFTDEDFIAPDLSITERLVSRLKDLGPLQFTIAARVDSIFNVLESQQAFERRYALLKELVSAGLYLVCLGVESFSDTQLQRYGKGISTVNSVRAIAVLQELGLPMELGFILFDPLLTERELHENVEQLHRDSTWKHVGQLFNSLRVQSGTVMEIILARRDLLGSFDPNTITYGYRFVDPVVAGIAELCLQWKAEIDDVYALARNAQRCGFALEACEKFVESFRFLELNILTALLGTSHGGSAIGKISTFDGERARLVGDLERSISELVGLSPAIAALHVATIRFLKDKRTAPCQSGRL